MKQIAIYLLLILSTVIISCQSNHENTSLNSASETPLTQTSKETPTEPTPEENQIEPTERKLIKEGNVEFETENIKSTRKTIFRAVEKYNGYTSSDREFNYPERTSNTLMIRVPAKYFDDLLEEATKGIDKFESKEIKVKDVTEKFLDIQARLKTKKELEARYLSLLDKANTVNEMLEIEKDLGTIRTEIESVEGKLKYLENKVAYSTLTLTFYERIPSQTEFGRKFKKGFRQGWDNLIWFFVFLTNIWPFVLIVIGAIAGIRFYRKRKGKKQD